MTTPAPPAPAPPAAATPLSPRTAWRRAGLAVLGLALACVVVVPVAAGTLPALDPVGVDAAPGFAGREPRSTELTGPALVATGLERFDALWYLAIAADGYPDTDGVPQAAAFFPGYPVVVAGLGAVLGGRLQLAATLVSALAAAAALAGLHQLALLVAGSGTGRGDAVDPAVDTPDAMAQRTVLFAAAFPTAFFLLAPYSESLFLAAAVWSLVLAARDRPLAAAALAALAAATRPVGVLLALPLVLGVVPPVRLPRSLRDVVRRLLPVAGVGLGGLAVLAHGWLRWGDPFAVASAQTAWKRELFAPWTSAWRAARFAVEDLGAGTTGYHLLDLVVVGAAVLGLVALARRRQWPLALHGAANVLLWLVQPFPGRPLLSAPRFALVVPGVMIGLALAARTPGRERMALLVSAGLFALHLTLFTRWWYVF